MRQFIRKAFTGKRETLIKTSFEWRRTGGQLLAVQGNQFVFNSATTANTFISPNTNLSGNQFATLLLGAIDDQSQAVAVPVNRNRIQYYAAFIQDDIKLSRDLTINIGLRYEYETPWHDPLYQQSRGSRLKCAHAESIGQSSADSRLDHIDAQRAL